MLNQAVKARLIRFGQALINQETARMIIEPMQRHKGFWSGGGNLEEGSDGNFYLVGR